MTDLQQLALVPVTDLSGVGPQLAGKLARLGIHSVCDILFHFPSRYQDRSSVRPIGGLQPGMECLVLGKIELTQINRGRRRSLLVRISDVTGQFTMRLFYFNKNQHAALRTGHWIQCYGEVRRGPNTLEMIHPEYRCFREQPISVTEPCLTPVYPTTEGIGQSMLRKLINQALPRLTGSQDWMPDGLRRRYRFPLLDECVRSLHRPPAGLEQVLISASESPMVKRLAFDELLAHHLTMRKIKARRRQYRALQFAGGGEFRKRFLRRLPFQLTAAQDRVIEEISNDLARPRPMYRLVQGDVGSGKTVVAAIAALEVIEAGYQVAFMAPTELLAEQHYRSFLDWYSPLEIPVGWLSSRIKSNQRKSVLAGLRDGGLPIVVGTHALFQEDVAIQQLGLMIIDEQHRFGVGQRLALRDKGKKGKRLPHQLTMTATPIPRSLAMTFYADLDVSSIDEMPPGRLPVETVAMEESRREQVSSRVKTACEGDKQVYWVCPMIDDSDVLEAQAATETAERLQRELPGIAVGLVHGRMSASEKDQIMADFRAGAVQLLVATTVIEVGVDVPNASLMIIENVERLGLAQMHQLRGRVGRGGQRACCVLMYRSPLSDIARSRIAVMRRTNDGFEIAQQDLEQRGPGELLGKRQTGVPQFRVADLQRDKVYVSDVVDVARDLLRNSPAAADALLAFWTGDDPVYADV